MTGPYSLTMAERRAVALLTVLSVQWPPSQDRDTLLDLLDEVRPQLRPLYPVSELAQAARSLVLARSRPADYAAALTHATLALVRVCRAEVIETFAAERAAQRQAG